MILHFLPMSCWGGAWPVLGCGRHFGGDEAACLVPDCGRGRLARGPKQFSECQMLCRAPWRSRLCGVAAQASWQTRAGERRTARLEIENGWWPCSGRSTSDIQGFRRRGRACEVWILWRDGRRLLLGIRDTHGVWLDPARGRPEAVVAHWREGVFVQGPRRELCQTPAHARRGDHHPLDEAARVGGSCLC